MSTNNSGLQKTDIMGQRIQLGLGKALENEEPDKMANNV